MTMTEADYQELQRLRKESDALMQDMNLRNEAAAILKQMTLEDVQRFLDWWKGRSEQPKSISDTLVPASGVLVYVDGGCSGNGTANARAYGSYKIGSKQQQEIVWARDAVNTNNEAEYKTLITALADLESQAIRNARILMDSALVVNQVNSKWKIREPRLFALCNEAKRLLQATGASLEWTPRENIVKVLGH